ncbi:hypothetical protein SUGI_0086820 [Cryptomeria japonica]|uniref:RNA polymerase II degradation factor 1 n=1 Tax=Cryptomeria japonica TaxID=3369 RepID=UPI002408C56D|nr:RNA polymerase II degradation factor 1 [Cryptomeria japonica]GLJ08343.1 hypothetical protein SUGI_0086820 [Cryptomeria japonica]
MDYGDYSAVPPPCLHSSEDYFLIQRELTQQYHLVLAEQEIGFRERLHQLLLQSPSLQTQILQPKFNKKLQQFGSRSPISGLFKRQGWCAVCCVDCKTEAVLEKHFFGKKHQSALAKLKECFREGREENSNQEEPSTEQQQEDKNKISLKENPKQEEPNTEQQQEDKNNSVKENSKQEEPNTDQEQEDKNKVSVKENAELNEKLQIMVLE